MRGRWPDEMMDGGRCFGGEGEERKGGRFAFCGSEHFKPFALRISGMVKRIKKQTMRFKSMF